MKYFSKLNILFLSLLCLAGCIEPYDVKINDPEKLLVVSGMITDEPGPYTVKLNTSYAYGEYFGEADPYVEDAIVEIKDDLGNTEILTEGEPGIYTTSVTGIKGRAGGKYQLHIRLKNGRKYISETETLSATPPIERLYTTLKSTLEVDKEGNEVTRNYVEFKVDVRDPGNSPNYYRWTYTSTNQITTQPEDHTTVDKKGNVVPDPKPCCRHCWITKSNTIGTVSSDRKFNGNLLAGQTVASIPFLPEFFQNKYHIELKQYAISEKAFMFWQTLKGQIAGGGSIQAPTPANAIGNITNTENAQEKVLGYFSAAGVSTKAMFVFPNDFSMNAGILVFPDDCQVAPGATTDMPSFW